MTTENLHGASGEDGALRDILALTGVPFVGATASSARLTWDKSIAKILVSKSGVQTPASITLPKETFRELDAETVLKTVSAAMTFPVVVKPARSGSSRGTTKVKSAGELAAAVAEAHRFDPKAMVENAVIGREIECAVLEMEGTPRASVVGQIEIDSKFEFYEFEAKYLDGATSITLPAPIAPEISALIQAKAVEAFISLGCSGLARVDFFVTPNGEVIINELNTMPGFTATSVFPKMWAATGVGYTQVITHLLKSALTRNNGVLGN